MYFSLSNMQPSLSWLLTLLNLSARLPSVSCRFCLSELVTEHQQLVFWRRPDYRHRCQIPTSWYTICQGDLIPLIDLVCNWASHDLSVWWIHIFWGKVGLNVPSIQSPSSSCCIGSISFSVFVRGPNRYPTGFLDLSGFSYISIQPTCMSWWIVS